MCQGRITLLRSVMIFCFILLPVADQETITAQSGQDVTLTCRAPNNNLIVVEWRRPDLGEVFVYRNNHFDSDDQHPSFKNRVDLQDRQMKDGDVSVILKDAMINDTGTYECRVFMEGTNRGKRAHQTIDPISIIYLRVVDPPEFLPEPNVIYSSLKSSTSPNTGIQLLLSNWSTQQLRPDTFTVNTLVYIQFVLLMKETSHNH
ncbi:uncharacterized protein LOC143415653 isoform X1 [Maylandia zebra]|uniref:uncharacterized protein LOC143415653 isoform X1 n=1 Tax=Maylandia zebra TaxID=106582 RepID=UPI00403CE4F3